MKRDAFKDGFNELGTNRPQKIRSNQAKMMKVLPGKQINTTLAPNKPIVTNTIKGKTQATPEQRTAMIQNKLNQKVTAQTGINPNEFAPVPNPTPKRVMPKVVGSFIKAK